MNGVSVRRIAGVCLAGAALAASAVCADGQGTRTEPSLAALRAGFAAPPAEGRLRCYWWWLNGHTDKATIASDLRAMKAKGFGGALLVDANGADQGGNAAVPAGPTFGRGGWVELYRFALVEAQELGLEITLNINSGWNLGGPVISPTMASKVVTWSSSLVKGGQETVKLAQPPMKEGFYRDIEVAAFPARYARVLTGQERHALAMKTVSVETGFSMPESDWMLSGSGAAGGGIPRAEMRDVTAQMRPDGTLAWTAPAGGDWVVLRIGYTCSGAKVSTSSGAWQGLALDHMSRTAFDSYWDRVVEPLLRVADRYHSLKTLATDSWELGGTNWTETFAEEFKQRRGYDPLPWLAAMTGQVVESPEATDRFLADVRRTVADLIEANHYARFAERAAEHHLGVQAESGGPHGAPIDALETFAHSAVPQTEFWSVNAHRSTDKDRYFVKEAASAANIYGQRLVADEGETSVGPQWSESLKADLKPSFDMAVTEGMNRLVWHEFTSSPAETGLPGQEYFAGTHLNPKVTWWDAGDAWFTYVNRVQWMMQQGTAVDDALYFYGDNVPAFVRLKADDPARVLPGFDYDVTDEDALLHRLRVQGAELVGPGGVRWRVLVLPKSGRVSVEVLEFARRYVQGGGTLAGARPTSPAGRVDAAVQERFDAAVNDLWGTGACVDGTVRRVGAGTAVCGGDGRVALAAAHVLPDVEAQDAGAHFGSSFDYAHRRAGGTDVYFVRNGSAQAVDEEVTFRVQGETTEMWLPDTGARFKLEGKATGDGRTGVQVALPAYGSGFVVFHAGASDAKAQPVRTAEVPVAPSAGWTLAFQPGRGAPASVHVDALTSWTEMPEAGLRYFSGTATYTASVEAPAAGAGQQVWLRFSDVREVARVWVNGHAAGTVWDEPLAVRVDPWLHAGANELRIEVTNLWPNRLIGDAQPGDHARYTQTNIRAYTAKSPLLPSGLIGPLTWELRGTR